MKTTIRLLIAATLFLAACKKDEPVTPENTTVYDKFYPSHRISFTDWYKDGVVTKKDTSEQFYTIEETWTFQKDGMLIRYIKSSNTTQQTTFATKGDSLIIEPGEIYAQQARFAITKLDGGVMQLSSGSTNRSAGAYDSAVYKTVIDYNRLFDDH